MKRAIVFILAMLFLAIPPAGCSPAQTPAEDSGNILVAYFSNTGNTERVAQIIAGQTGGTLREIVPETPYTSADLDYSDSGCRANREQNDPSARPAIDGEIDDFAKYDTIFIGHPI